MVKISASTVINVFIIGNNPIELSTVYDRLRSIKNRTFNTEVGFELKGLYKKIMKFRPACILIDDNVERTYLLKLVKRLRNSKRTSSVPITILKSNNRDSRVEFAEDFILKGNITKEVLGKSIQNAIRLNKFHTHLRVEYKKRKRKVLAL